MEWRPLDLTVISANGVKNVNFFSTMDVYVEVSIIGYAKNKKKTFVDKKGGTSPRWNHRMNFTLDEPSLYKPGLSLLFRLRSDRLFGDKDIGIVSVPIHELSNDNVGVDRIVEYQVYTPVSGRPKGTLKFSYKFGPKYGQPPQQPSVQHVNQPRPAYNEKPRVDQPVTAYPAPQATEAGMPTGMAYQQQPPAVYPPAGYGGYPPPAYGGYASQQGYGYPPVQKPQKTSNIGGMGAGLGLGLGAGLLGGMLVGEMDSDVGQMHAYEQGYEDAMDDVGDMDF